MDKSISNIEYSKARERRDEIAKKYGSISNMPQYLYEEFSRCNDIVNAYNQPAEQQTVKPKEVDPQTANFRQAKQNYQAKNVVVRAFNKITGKTPKWQKLWSEYVMGNELATQQVENMSRGK